MRSSDRDISIPVSDARLLRDLGHPVRLKIMGFLRDGEKNVSEIIDLLGSPAQPRVSSHLAGLRIGGYVYPRRVGKYVYYSIRDPRVPKLLEALSGEGEDIRPL